MNSESKYFIKHIIPGKFGEYLHDHSLFYYYVESRIYRLLEAFGVRKTYNDYVLELYEPDSVHLRLHRASFRKLMSELPREDLRIVIIPILHRFDDYQFSIAHRYVKSEAARFGVEVIDLLDAFKGMKAEDLIANPHDFHFNEKAHAIVADYVYIKLKESGFI
jgi:hypothetical protein